MNASLATQPGGFELHCRRYEPMIGWYRSLLEARVIYRDPVQCLLRAPAGWHLLLLNTHYGERPRESMGLGGLSLELPGGAALIALYRRLKLRNLYPARAARNACMTSLVYRDPDGGLLTLRSFRPAAVAEPVDLMGEEFDPEQLYEGFSEPAV